MSPEEIAVYVVAFFAYSMLMIAYFYCLKNIWKDLADMRNECRAIVSDLQDISSTVNELKNEL